MENINLLQNRIKDTTFAWKRQSKWILAFLTLVLVGILGVSAALYFYNSKVQADLNDANAKLAALQNTLNEKQSTLGDAKTFQAQIANIKTLLNSHAYLSPLLDEIGKSTYNKAQLLSFDVSEDTGRVHMEGVVPSYTDLSKLLLGLSTSPKFSNVKLLAILPSLGQTNDYHFAIELTGAPELFKAQ